jgi:hypothetical protein
MLEFSSISVSTYDSASLADRLTEHSAQGWSVVSIVQTGTTVTAFISRPTGQTATAASPAAIVPEVVEATPYASSTSAAASGLDSTSALSGETSLATSGDTVVDTDRYSTSEKSVSDTASSSSTSGESGSTGTVAPAGWYADPANRFELRYWDGDKWTEYVSRGGQQFTDPPVA